ncbi:MAG: polymer-forming cytoskeletal protein [Spirochaetales bacterium]|nr:polymer-forming cytoskeletal protein [Spirochaetales bacterium]
MGDNQIPDKTVLNSIIGAGTRFKGEFDLNGLLRIDGDFSGIIRTKGKVLVGSNGRVECTMYAGTVVIGGIVRGDIFSTEKVTILSTGMVIGNIQSPRLVIEDGVILNGNCRIKKNIIHDAKIEDNEDINNNDNRNNSIFQNNPHKSYEINEQSPAPPENNSVVSLYPD